MQFSNPRFMLFENEILAIAEKFDLKIDDLTVENFIPNSTAILVENVDGHLFRIHINLQENRIIAAKQLDSDHAEKSLFAKYTAYMK